MTAGLWSLRRLTPRLYKDLARRGARLAAGLADAGAAYVFVRSGGTWVQDAKDWTQILSPFGLGLAAISLVTVPRVTCSLTMMMMHFAPGIASSPSAGRRATPCA